MTPEDIGLPPYLQRMVNADVSGLDIMHGELKNLMLIAEKNMILAQNDEPLAEDEYDESDDYHHGYLDALTAVYKLTYDLSFAIGERNAN
jgi:hypothetical protein